MAKRMRELGASGLFEYIVGGCLRDHAATYCSDESCGEGLAPRNCWKFRSLPVCLGLEPLNIGDDSLFVERG
ncbi:hypothetical protein ACULNC_11760 [Shigella flexneri]